MKTSIKEYLQEHDKAQINDLAKELVILLIPRSVPETVWCAVPAGGRSAALQGLPPPPRRRP